MKLGKSEEDFFLCPTRTFDFGLRKTLFKVAKLVFQVSAVPKITVSYSANMLFKRRMSIGSRRFPFLGSGFASVLPRFSGKFVSMRVKTLSNTKFGSVKVYLK